MLRFVVGFVLLLSLVHGQEPPPLTEDNTAILDVQGRADVNPQSWTDSYSVGDACYCLTTFDHDIGEYIVEISTLGNITVRQACELVGPGPGAESRPVYNDIQCGNGPANTARDEVECPGRTDHGQEGCGYIGPKWKFPDNATLLTVTMVKGDESSAPAITSLNAILATVVGAGSLQLWFVL